MKFKARYRNDSGKIESVFIEAPSRTECFNQLKDKGIVPFFVDECRSAYGEKGTSMQHVSYKRILSLCAWAIIGIAIIYALFIFRFTESPKTTTEKESGFKKKVQEVSVTNRTKSLKKEKVMSPQRVKDSQLMDSPSGEPYKVLKVLPDGTEVYLNSKGEKCAFFNRGTEKDLIFHTKLENMLAWYAVPGKDIPPLPPLRLSEEEIAAGLDAVIEYNEKKDDEKSLEVKLAVAEMKEMLRESLKKGSTVKDFLGELAKRQMMEANAVKQSRALVMEALSKGKTDEARTLLDSLNKDLKEAGIPQVHIHPKHWEASDAMAREKGDE